MGAYDDVVQEAWSIGAVDKGDQGGHLLVPRPDHSQEEVNHYIPHHQHSLKYHFVHPLVLKRSFSEVFLPVEQRIDGCAQKEQDGGCDESYLVQKRSIFDDVED